MKILFLGSPRFSVEILKKLASSKHQVVAVVTQPDRPSGRGHKLCPTEVKKYAIENGIKVFDFEKVCDHIEEIKKIDFDISVTASFGQILRENFLSLSPCINVHPSLLPKYRGATPIQSAILSGDKKTGVSIMKVVREVDAGDVYLQEELAIDDEDDYLSLEAKLASLGGDMLVRVLDKFEKCEEKAWVQKENEATFCKKITKEDCFLDMNLTAKELESKCRALKEYGTYIFIDGERLKIAKLKDVSEEFSFVQIGKPLSGSKRFIIGCKGGAVEVISCLGKSGKYISGRDFLNGCKLEGKKIN